MITLHRTNSDNADFRTMVTLLDHDLKTRDGEDHSFYTQFNTLKRINHALVAYKKIFRLAPAPSGSTIRKAWRSKECLSNPNTVAWELPAWF